MSPWRGQLLAPFRLPLPFRNHVHSAASNSSQSVIELREVNIRVVDPASKASKPKNPTDPANARGTDALETDSSSTQTIVSSARNPAAQDAKNKGVGPANPQVQVPSRFLTLDPNGDLYLLVGKQAFRVCSRTISRASPVFNRMLYGVPKFAEAKPDDENGGPWVVRLHEDDEQHMYFVLLILHGKPCQIAVKLRSITLIYGMLVIADKYVCTDIVRPLLRMWLPSTRLLALLKRTEEYQDDVDIPCVILCTAWQLGYRVAFDAAVVRLIRVAFLPNSDPAPISWNPSGSTPSIEKWVLMPSEISDIALEAREKVLEDIWAKIDGLKTCLTGCPVCSDHSLAITLSILDFKFNEPFKPWPKRTGSLTRLLKSSRERSANLGNRVLLHEECDPCARLTAIWDYFYALDIHSLVGSIDKMQPFWDELDKREAKIKELYHYCGKG